MQQISKIKYRLIHFPIILIVTFLVSYFILKMFSDKNEVLLKKTHDNYFPLVEISIKIDNVLFSIQNSLKDAVAIADTSKFVESDKNSKIFLELCDSLSNRDIANTNIDSISTKFRVYYKHARNVSKQMITGNITQELLAQITKMIEKYNQLKIDVNNLKFKTKQSITIHFDEVEKNNEISAKISLFVVLTGFIISLIVTYFVGRTVIGPFRKLNKDLRNSNFQLKEKNSDLNIANQTIAENLVQKNRLVLELTTIKEKLELLNSEKDKFFSIIAHDLRSPFQGFIGITEIMATGIEQLTKEEMTHFGKQMNNNAKNLFKLLENLLEWARMQSDSIEFNPSNIDLTKTINENVDLIIKRCEQKGIQVSLEVEPNHTVFADEDMLNSIFRNLLSNAVKFTNTGGIISVKTNKKAENIIEIVVSDSGIGMPESILKRLFKIEEKVGRKGTDGELSTGLGLLLCKDFVEKNEGTIWAESIEGKGSTFYFTLRTL